MEIIQSLLRSFLKVLGQRHEGVFHLRFLDQFDFHLNFSRHDFIPFHIFIYSFFVHLVVLGL